MIVTGEADNATDMMKNSLESTFPDEFEIAPGVDYLSPDIKAAGVTKAVYGGYLLIVAAIARVLLKPDEDGIPYAEAVFEEIAGVKQLTARYFDEGGNVTDAVDFVVHLAKDTSPTGDGS